MTEFCIDYRIKNFRYILRNSHADIWLPVRMSDIFAFLAKKPVQGSELALCGK